MVLERPDAPPPPLEKKRHAERARLGDHFRAGRTGDRRIAPRRTGTTYVGPSALHSALYCNRIAQRIGATATELE
jgi:hypothetical protein